MWENTGLSLDELIRDRRRARRPTPYSLYSADIGKGARRPGGGGRGLGSPGGSSLGGSPRGIGATLSGRVRSFDPRTGWGFIESETIRSKTIILHEGELLDRAQTPKPGDYVEFELTRSANGNSCAAMVRVVCAASPEHLPAPRRHNVLLTPGPFAVNVPRGLRGSPSAPAAAVPPLAPPNGLAALTQPFGGADGPETFYIGDGSTPRSVSSARPPEKAPGFRIRIKNFPWTMTWQQVKAAFEELGEVLRVDFDERRVGQAVVTFRDLRAAQLAVKEYNRGLLNDREIFVRHEK